MNRTAVLLPALLSLSLVGCAQVDPNADSHPVNTASRAEQTGQGGTGPSGGSATPAASGDPSESPTPSPTPTPTPKPAIKLTSKRPIDALLPTDSLEVEVTDGELKELAVTDSQGKSVEGTLNHTSWSPTRNLLPQEGYTATATVVDAQGTSSKLTSKFSTIKTNIAGYDILYAGFTTGVGMPATIQFVSAVETPAMRAEVEKHVKVSVVPAQEGSWGWLDNRQLMWRPKTFFKPGTKITVTANLAGVQTGANKWAKKDSTQSYSIGNARVLHTDVARHQMRVTENGKTVRTIPITNGKKGFTTRSGTKVIIERHKDIKMDSTTVDIPKDSPDAYSLDVKYALRTTWTGEFIHAAPWSVGSQGKVNVSHGCTGMSTENAKWLFDFVRAGDLDVVSGTDRQMQPVEGIGVWQYSWQQWQQRSAL